MTRDEKIAEALRLRGEGWTLKDIAKRLGYANHASVWRLLHIEEARAAARQQNVQRRAAKRAWEREHDRGRCPCGSLTSRRVYTLCDPCHRETLMVGRAMREERIAEMWEQGLTLREIAGALGSTAGSIKRSMAEMRNRGWDLPRRRNWSPESIERQREIGRRRAA